MTIKKGIYWKSGGSADVFIELLQDDCVELHDIFHVIDQNVSRFHPLHPLYYLSHEKHDFRSLEKAKILLILFDYLTDSRRFELTKKEFTSLNAIRFILQKIVYSLMHDLGTEQAKGISQLWYTSLLKLFIESNLFWFKTTGGSLTSDITEVFDKDLSKKWKTYSTFSHYYNKNPFLVNNKLDTYKIFQDIKEIIGTYEKSIIPEITQYFKNNDVKIVIEKISACLQKIDGIDKDIDYLPKTLLDIEHKSYRLYEFYLFISKYNDAVGFSNPPFLRAFNCLGIDVSAQDKKIMANCSHKDIYKYIPLNKWNNVTNKFDKLNIDNNILVATNNYIESIIKRFNNTQ